MEENSTQTQSRTLHHFKEVKALRIVWWNQTSGEWGYNMSLIIVYFVNQKLSLQSLKCGSELLVAILGL